MIQHATTLDFDAIRRDAGAMNDLRNAVEEIRRKRHLDAHNIALGDTPPDRKRLEVGKIALVIENLGLACGLPRELPDLPVIPVDKPLLAWALGQLEELAEPGAVTLVNLRAATGVGSKAGDLPLRAGQRLEELASRQSGTGQDEGMAVG